jgi:hypothetical protein
MSPVAGEHVEPREVEEDDLGADHDDTPLRVRTIDDLIRNATAPELMHHALHAELNFTSVEEPATFIEAEKDVA